MTPSPSKSELLETIHRSWNELNEIIASLSAEQLIQSGAMDDWSLKDIMAHITAWEWLAMDRIHAAQTGEPLKYPAIKGDSFVDAFNAEVYENNQAAPLPKVMEAFHKTHAEFIEQIEVLDAERLPQPLPFDWAGNLTFQVLIFSNTHWHYVEHIEAVEKWLDTLA